MRTGLTTMCQDARMIPATAHFIWLGPAFPWFNVLAVRSALDRGEFDKAVIHHDHPPHAGNWSALLVDDRVHARRIDVKQMCEAAGVPADPITSLLSELVAPAARSNVLRCLALAGEGGVYLDTDTVTIRTLTDLRQANGVFCGQERVAAPARWQSPGWRRTWSWALMGVRHAFRAWPRGYVPFRRIERLYPLAVNNAVLGSVPHHPLLMTLLAAMVNMSPERRKRRFALGTHLLQQHIEREAHDGVRVYPPDFFYPLPPAIADHWFRSHSKHDVDRVVSANTRVVHWYGSHHRRTHMQRLDPAYVKANAKQQMLSQLAAPFCG